MNNCFYFTIPSSFLTGLEILGHTYKKNTKPIYVPQKKAISIKSRANYYDPINTLFVALYLLRFYESVNYKTLQIMYKVQNKLLPLRIQNLFRMEVIYGTATIVK